MDPLKHPEIPLFSKKILLLSFLVLLAHFSWIGVRVGLRPLDTPLRGVAPRLIFVQGQEVSVKGFWENDFRNARPSELVRAGTKIKTGPDSFAELQSEGNFLRLDENTEIALEDNRFESGFSYDPDAPRLVFRLGSGSAWVRSAEPIQIDLPQSTLTVSGGVGSATASGGMNHLFVITGSGDLLLRDAAGETIASFFVPLRHQVTFADSQITSAYAQLKSSKLKKELKLRLVPPEVMQEPWVRRNLTEAKGLGEASVYPSRLKYTLHDAYDRFRELLAFRDASFQRIRLERVQHLLHFLAGKARSDSAAEEIAALSAKLDSLLKAVNQKGEAKRMLTQSFYFLERTAYGSSAFEFKETLRQRLIPQSSSRFLRTYLAEAEKNFDRVDLLELLPHLEAWLQAWAERTSLEEALEFEKQSALFTSLLLTHSARVPQEYSALLDQVLDRKAEFFSGEPERLMDAMEDRLNWVGALTEHARYSLAKSYLSASYKRLSDPSLALNPLGQEVLRERAELLAERLAFFQQTLHGAAGPTDEQAFLNYLELKKRDESLSSTLQSFLTEEELPEEGEISIPQPQDVMQRFMQARISVIQDDIKETPDSPFSFAVKNARILSPLGSQKTLVFDAVYDYLTNAVHDIQVNGKPFKGNFELFDLVAVLIQENILKEPSPSFSEFDPDSLLDETLDETQRTQVLAQDLAVQLVQEALKRAGLELGEDPIEILDTSTLTRFHIPEARVPHPGDLSRFLRLQFDFNLATQMVTNVSGAERGLLLPASIPLQDLRRVVYETVEGAEREEGKIRKIQEEFRAKGLSFNASTVTFESGDRLRFSELVVEALATPVSGVYDLTQERFLEVHHPLLNETNVTMDAYFNRLGPLVVSQFLKAKGLAIEPDQFQMVFPFTVITVRNYPAGKTLLDFQVNVKGNRLEQISIQGTNAPVDSMSFEEFLGVVGSFNE